MRDGIVWSLAASVRVQTCVALLVCVNLRLHGDVDSHDDLHARAEVRVSNEGA